MSDLKRVRVLASDIVYQGWAVVKSVTLDYLRRDGALSRQTRLIAEHGDGAAVLLHDPDRGTVLLVRQFRLAAYLSGHGDSLLEACAGRLEGDDPETCVRREALEELGYRVTALEHVFTAYSCPGFDTEKLFGFVARYSPADRVESGGGLADEGEDIEVVEMAFDEAFAGIRSGDIADAKTVMLLQHLKISGVMG
jgi:nudix-type nucleoside diphosphatase (YffH/AdpP family)